MTPFDTGVGRVGLNIEMEGNRGPRGGPNNI